jgi:hypothetical protein
VVTDVEIKPYYEAIEGFMRELSSLDVSSLCMVALTRDPDVYDVVSCFGAGPHEIAACAGILQMHAAYKYGEVNRPNEECE